MGILYIAGQRPGAGATAIATVLATLWNRPGIRIAVVKPASLSVDTTDGDLYARLFPSTDDATPVLIAAGEVPDAFLEEASERVTALTEKADAVIVEGIPYSDAEGNPVAASPALAEHLGARVLGVVPYDRSLGGTAAAAWRDTYASSLAGVLLNRLMRYGGHDAATRVVPSFEDAGVSVLGTLPEERLLLAPTVRQVADLLDGAFYAGLSGDSQLIEHFLIGGLITEWGGNYFGRLPNQAVVTRGGRTDIQMSALNFPLNCLLLTSCESPPQYVYQRAEELDVPLVTVKRDTFATAAALESLAQQVTIDHPDKIARLSSMMEQAVDLTAARAMAGLRGSF